MDMKEIKWRLDDIVKKYEDEIDQLKAQKGKSDIYRQDAIQALRACRTMFEMSLVYVVGTPTEDNFRIYMNIISGVIGDFNHHDADMITPEKHGEWITEQLNKRHY